MSAREMPRRHTDPLLVVAMALVALASGCGPRAPQRTTVTWLVGQSEPRFDPTGPADPVRSALERLLGQGLVAEDSTGHIVQAAARSWEVTPNGLAYTFHLRPGLRFDDGKACTSADFRRAIEAGLNRVDHSTYAWLLSPIVGVDRARPGRPLPPLGIATPDDQTLVLRLTRPDPTLLQKLALAGASTAWAPDASSGGWGGGIGAYRVVSRQPGRRLVLARRSEAEGPDTVRVEFAATPARARSALRAGRADLVWPVPPGMLAQTLPAGYREAIRPARPSRRLWLILRADLPPTRRIEVRRALAHGLNRPDILATLGGRAAEPETWLTGGGAIDLPRQDAGAVREWLARGRQGRSMHVVMVYAADGVGAEIARGMQAEWAAVAIDVELRPLRRGAMTSEALRRGGAQLMLVESQPPAADPVAELALLVEPRTAPPVGGFRTGWAMREFDPWIGPQPPETPLDLDRAALRLGEELVAIPLARLSWLWLERESGTPVRLHPRHGPELGLREGLSTAPHQSR